MKSIKIRETAIFLIVMMIFYLLPITGTVYAATPAITVSSQKVILNENSTDLMQYNIDGANYVKLRDLAMVLDCTSRQFSVGWDAATNTATITSGQPYSPDGTELSELSSENLTPIISKDKILIDGAISYLTAYKIGGRNYFKLKEFASALDVGCEYIADTNSVALTIKLNESYNNTLLNDSDAPVNQIVTTKDENGEIHEYMNYEFVLDKDAIGEWKVVDFVDTIDNFDPSAQYTHMNYWWYIGNSLYDDGTMIMHRMAGDDRHLEDDNLTWTKGHIMDMMKNSDMDVITRYEIKNINNKTYMFIEWKSADYTVRGEQPWYYVFVKTSDKPNSK